jgi:ribosomal protein L14E/L6E/L27E
MPLIGTSSVLAAARLAAEDAVKAAWKAKNKVLTPAEQQQMRLEMKKADSEAILAFLVLNTVVTTASPGGPGVGTIG